MVNVKWYQWGWGVLGVSAIAGVISSPLRLPVLNALNIPSAIGDVQSAPFWFPLPVCVAGTVGDRAPIVGGQLYQLKDSSGSIWIVSSDTSLQPGQSVKMKGTLQFQSIVIDGAEQGEVYIEQQASNRAAN